MSAVTFQCIKEKTKKEGYRGKRKKIMTKEEENVRKDKERKNERHRQRKKKKS